ncbi:hypothetical protein DAPPUDRAFT_314871 [Daphnia pulex]|uniref:Uncharacterized protein n=1 Tax=Daphnia pulex TaxID=6669 RepID=E9G7S5_DAPPU|nr:hypothetical protein DAPPUDRAFT_314871 [Daphnia pulex]|eukprot:EFX84530.1 hypothetical protein DAPPUDRAFT_314871 [Daphnia pulex]
MESLSAAPRSDPLQMRKQIELEMLQQKFAEKQAKIDKQAKELQSTMAKNAQELKDDEIECQKIEAEAAEYFVRVGDGFHQVLEQVENSPVSQEVMYV